MDCCNFYFKMFAILHKILFKIRSKFVEFIFFSHSSTRISNGYTCGHIWESPKGKVPNRTVDLESLSLNLFDPKVLPKNPSMLQAFPITLTR